MEESDVEMEVVFDDNIRIKKKENLVLKDKTNKINNSRKPITFYDDKENINNENDVLQKYNLDFDYENDKMTNEINNKFLDDISNKLRIFEHRDIKERFSNDFNKIHFDNLRRNNLKMYRDNLNSKEFLNNNIDIENYDLSKFSNENNKINYNNISNENIIEKNLIKEDKLEENNYEKSAKNILINNASSSIIYEIQNEFNDLKESHKTMLLLRNRLLILLDKEVQSIKKEVEDKKNEEILKLEEEFKLREDKLKKESEYYKNRYDKFKEYCKDKVIEYKKKIDYIYRNKKK